MAIFVKTLGPKRYRISHSWFFWTLIPPVIRGNFIGFDHPHKPRSWEELDCGWHPQRALRKRPPAPARQSDLWDLWDLWPPVRRRGHQTWLGNPLLVSCFSRILPGVSSIISGFLTFSHLKSGFLYMEKSSNQGFSSASHVWLPEASNQPLVQSWIWWLWSQKLWRSGKRGRWFLSGFQHLLILMPQMGCAHRSLPCPSR